MTPRIAADLASLAPGDLAEELAEWANQMRDALKDGQTVDVLEALNQLQEAARKARGPQLDLLEVACALLKLVTRVDLGEAELAAHRLLTEHGSAGEAFLDRVSARQVSRAEMKQLPTSLREHVGRLVALGVLREADGFVDTAPTYRTFLADLREPSPLREWREVTEARNEVFNRQMDNRTAAQYMASRFGIRDEDAARHIRRHPPIEWLSTIPNTSRYQRPPILGPGQHGTPKPSDEAAAADTTPAYLQNADASELLEGDLDSTQLQ